MRASWRRRTLFGLVLGLGIVVLATVAVLGLARHQVAEGGSRWRTALVGADDVLDADDRRLLVSSWTTGPTTEDRTDQLHVLSRTDGTQLYTLPDVSRGTLLEDGVLAESPTTGSADRTLSRTDAEGRPRWSVDLGPRATLRAVSEEGRRVVLEDSERVIGLDLDTGEEEWTLPGRYGFRYPEAPVERSEYVAVQPEGTGSGPDEREQVLHDVVDATPVGRWQGNAIHPGLGPVTLGDADGCAVPYFLDGAEQALDWDGLEQPERCSWASTTSTEWAWLIGGDRLFGVELATGTVREADLTVTDGLADQLYDRPPGRHLVALDPGGQLAVLDAATGQRTWSQPWPEERYHAETGEGAVITRGRPTRWQQLGGADPGDDSRFELRSPDGTVLADVIGGFLGRGLAVPATRVLDEGTAVLVDDDEVILLAARP